jgi:hypothetical protein
MTTTITSDNPTTQLLSIELVVFAKTGGPLTKRISLAPDGSLKSDGSACIMAQGQARRAAITSVADLGALIERLDSNEALALGSLRPGLPDQVEVVTKRKLNGVASVIARTAEALSYRKGKPAFALLDFDSKGMPDAVRTELRRHGNYVAALVSVLPALRDVARLSRRSTSAGLFRADNGQQLPGSDGVHVYALVKDGSDIGRFLADLHHRCWLAGLGWFMVGAAGQLLERSIVDRMVGAAERLVFEGAPILDEPLRQDRDSRRPRVTDGVALDTLAACPPLTVVEQSRLRELKVKAAYQLDNARAKARADFISRQTKRLIEAKGISEGEAERIVKRQCEGILLSYAILPFDDEELTSCTVADVLADPDRFVGETLADPLEGPDYGTGKARIMRRTDGTLWINSFAHGRTVYELKLDRAAVEAAMARVEGEAVARVFLDLIARADLDAIDIEALRIEAAERSGLGRRELSAQLKEMRRQQAAKQKEEVRARRLRERRDPRPHITVPASDQDWLPQMAIVNDVLGASPAAKPPARNIDGTMTRTRKLSLPNMHTFASSEAASNDLPAPEQWLLRQMNEMEVAELIEQHIDYIDENGRSVHLPMPFVRHYVNRDDDVLPTLVAIATLPIVLDDGSLLAPDGLDRERGIIFEIQNELRAVLPRREDCDAAAVRKAMEFLCGEWLCDVATDYIGKCILVSAALTWIERSLLPDRPAYFVTAGRRCAGKTTTLKMLIKAMTGDWPSAAAWSTNEEERRKALLSYFLSGVSYILWDNIGRGSQISCPHIEKSCTSAYYSDRKLGVSEMVATAASAIHFFTGNNIAPCGDLASRSLNIRLAVDRPDPENRDFEHPDPVGWTETNRAAILRALYTVLLGNPLLGQRGAKAKTRFKHWWWLVGSAVEHAANLIGQQLDFQMLFAAQEEDEEEAVALAEALVIMRRHWPVEFKAGHVADFINQKDAVPDGDDEKKKKEIVQDIKDRIALRDFLFGQTTTGFVATPKGVGKRLRAHVDEPVRVGDQVLALVRSVDRDDVSHFSVVEPKNDSS